MRTTIDRAGRVVIPQAVRRRLGLDAGTAFEIEEVDGTVVLRPESRITVEMAEDGLPIVRTPEGGAPVTAEDIRRVLEDVREWPRGS
jgi:AbrB family looped-hinge helix DNA binding protein